MIRRDDVGLSWKQEGTRSGVFKPPDLLPPVMSRETGGSPRPYFVSAPILAEIA
jgi:hypothetical protein